ncbi:MAG TPA: hypothetical protein ACFCUY_17600 [Xenococcaceae cyanobacterium]
MAKRRNAKKEKAKRNQINARKFRKPTSRYSNRNRKYYGNKDKKSEDGENQNSEDTQASTKTSE